MLLASTWVVILIKHPYLQQSKAAPQGVVGQLLLNLLVPFI